MAKRDVRRPHLHGYGHAHHERDREGQHHHRHHRHHKAAPSLVSRPPPFSRHHGRRGDRDGDFRVEIDARDLDWERQYFTFQVRPGVSISRIDTVIRNRSNPPIPEEALILFYRNGRELRPGAVVDAWPDSQTIFYRVLVGFEDVGLRVRMRHREPRREDDTGPGPGSLDKDGFANRLVQDIERGALTVRDVRARLAEQLNVDDPNRVVITAWGGMRPEHLEGNNWEVRQVQQWLCRVLTVEVRPKDQYLTLRGPGGREFIYHPKAADEPRASVRDIKSWLAKRIARGVHRLASSTLELRTKHVVLTRESDRGTDTLEGHAPIPWGSALNFTIPTDAAEQFVNDENWLLPPTESCMVCCEDKRAGEMPLRVTAACAHAPTLCKGCLRQWIQSSLEDTMWDRLKCPECPELLAYEDVRRSAGQEVFERYDKMAARAALKDLRNFHWCLAPGCDSGQIHPDSCPKFRCHACQARHCTTHSVAWHSGESCEAFDARNKKRRKEERKSEKAVKEMSRKCPECKRDVHKYTGCNHITCVCGHEWCYICFAAYRTTPQGFLRCVHTDTCTESDIFAELGFIPEVPPGLGGGRRPRPPPPPRWRGGPPPPPPPPGWRMPPFGVPPFAGGPPPPPPPPPPRAPVPPMFAEPPPGVRAEMQDRARRQAEAIFDEFLANGGPPRNLAEMTDRFRGFRFEDDEDD